MKRKSIKRKIGLAFIVAAIAVFGFAGWRVLEYKQGDDEYARISDLAKTSSSEEESAPEDPMDDALRINWDEMMSVNDDYIGWIHLASGASYPVVQGRDNTEYLKKGFEKGRNVNGCIFINKDNAPDFTDYNTLIYGHNMRRGAMFGSNRAYKEEAYANEHPYMWIHVKDGYYTYEITDCIVAKDGSAPYNTQIINPFEMEDYLASIDGMELYKRSTIERDDKIVSLSSCSGRSGGITRQIVQAKLVRYKSYDETEVLFKEDLAVVMRDETERIAMTTEDGQRVEYALDPESIGTYGYQLKEGDPAEISSPEGAAVSLRSSIPSDENLEAYTAYETLPTYKDARGRDWYIKEEESGIQYTCRDGQVLVILSAGYEPQDSEPATIKTAADLLTWRSFLPR